MAVTVTTAAQRTIRLRRERAAQFGPADIALAATSCAIALGICLAYLGRVAVLDRSDLPVGGALVDLNSVDRPELLEPGLAVGFGNLDDRRFAAGEWFAFLRDQRNANGRFLNVGAATRATVAAAAVDRTPRLDVYANRLTAAREAAASSGRSAPENLPLFTAENVAAIKPWYVVRTRAQFRNDVVVWSAVYLLAFQLAAWCWRLRAADGDRVLLAAAHLVSGLGFILLVSRPDALRDVPLFVRYTQGVVVGLALMSAFSAIDFGKTTLLELSYLPLLGAIALCGLLIVFGGGPGRSGAKVNLGPVQPIEAIRLLLGLFLAGYFARRWELLRGVRTRLIRGVEVPGWLNLPHGEYLLPVVAGVFVALGLFTIQKDLGPALLLCCVFLTMYAIARGGFRMAIAGFTLLLGGFYLGHLAHVSRTLSERVLMWRSPWDNAVAGGDQVAQAIWAMAAGGPLGAGVGLGDTRYISAGHTDLMIASLAEELGVIGVMVLAVAYAVIAWRGFRIARHASTDYGFFLATALTLFLIVPTLVMAAGVVGAIPLTGVVTPFLSYGGSAMATNLATLGILSSIHADRRPAADLGLFVTPLRWVGGSIAVAALALVVMIVDIQVIHADELLVRPQLGLQADGGRRYAYNPRLLDVLRRTQRGTIFDRRGLPLATDDAQVIAKARPEFQKLGISLDQVCSGTKRCYPLGGRAFHLLGDVRSRTNWSATNSSYIERDAESVLRGFDDHTTVVLTADSNGRAMSTVRRDYRELVPLVRHRYEPNHPAVVALRRRSSDVRTTIDVALQIRVAAIVEAHAKRASGKAAAVVLDPETGGVLASVSYPWPSADGGGDDVESEGDALLDRARYGLYPPGSTFKLVTAAAALNRDVSLAKAVFACSRLPDGRIGTTLSGWSRPVRDDVLDTHPHGTIDMHGGLVHSCNAYFAQLALRLGPQPLLDCAAKLGITLTPSANTAARVRDTLPQVGYGQADVLATPLRMARVAAAVASSGTVRDARWDQATPVKGNTLLAPSAARVLGGYMRDVVVSGTGSSLRNGTWAIAGKTGTAEVAGAPSHGWFVGYAPYGAAKKRIAFAVIIEHAGYGGRTAAPMAGEIVGAAGQSGLLQ
jgi:cell division protein FtsW (lipid II flippase)